MAVCHFEFDIEYEHGRREITQVVRLCREIGERKLLLNRLMTDDQEAGERIPGDLAQGCEEDLRMMEVR